MGLELNSRAWFLVLPSLGSDSYGGGGELRVFGLKARHVIARPGGPRAEGRLLVEVESISTVALLLFEFNDRLLTKL
jgi:hypothetical protein